MSAIAAAQGAACVADPGDQLAVARRVRLALRNGAIEHARLSHLQRLLRLPGLAGDKRGTGGSQVILRRRILADPRARQGRGDPGSRIARHDIAGLVGPRQRLADADLMAWPRAGSTVSAGWCQRLGRRDAHRKRGAGAYYARRAADNSRVQRLPREIKELRGRYAGQISGNFAHDALIRLAMMRLQIFGQMMRGVALAGAMTHHDDLSARELRRPRSFRSTRVLPAPVGPAPGIGPCARGDAGNDAGRRV